ncbi:MAG TPA: hypothetical protein VML54_13625, partial [Candidatus Limnocylindrales bacterium]|nr:hypothetical protein [Candidatus Limnocylindrales bacterium]
MADADLPAVSRSPAGDSAALPAPREGGRERAREESASPPPRAALLPRLAGLPLAAGLGLVVALG